MFRSITGYLAFVAICLLPLDCYAYIDPNAGGFLFQLLFPVLVAIGGVWTVFRQRIIALWNRLFRRGGKRERPTEA
ncbi:MAG: hypothetical protein V4568_05115 [Pseudomonadota bacterium]